MEDEDSEFATLKVSWSFYFWCHLSCNFQLNFIKTSSSNSIIFWSLIDSKDKSFHNTFKNAKAMEKCIFYFCNASIVRKCAIVTQALDKKAAQDQRDDKLKSINPIQTFTASCIHRGKEKVLQHFITLWMKKFYNKL